ncbi:MAG: efflux RND transporter permease subunit, partial [Lachnospiraceae bacterium]|nr:efflux RND transporter permease subunit [Lachnospiraceae bacterium]
VAQIYADIAARLVTDKTSTSFTVDNQKMDVQIVDETNLLTVENLMDMEFDTTVTEDDGTQSTETHKLSEFATIEHENALATIARDNGTHQITVTATTKDGYNTTRLSEKLMKEINKMDLPSGYTVDLGGEADEVNDMLSQMGKLLLLGLALVYLVMVAQFQSLLSPFIILFTVPLAFTGGLFGLVATGEQISIVSLLGFLVLMGTVVNNGIVFVDYTNQLRIAGMSKHEALIFTGKTRMRPILMTALTTILSMSTMVFSKDISAGMSRGMAVVVAAGLLYATLMTLFVVPIMYDILYRGEPKNIDVGDDLDEAPNEVSDDLNNM